jgi:subtilisin-like proprotein convertase family protein
LVSVPVSLDPIRGYNLPVDLSLEGLPAGATAGFAPPSASPLAVSSLTLGADDLVPLGSYPLQIVGTSGAIVQRTELRFSVEGALYGPFLDLPANGAGSVNPTPTLSWAAIAGAARYRVQVASEPGFSAPLVDQLVTGTSFTTPLTPGTEYFWRVHAGNSCGDGPFSDVRRFTTATISTISVSCTGLPLAMPDNDPAGVSCTLEAPADFVAVDVTFDVRIVHTWRGDLLLELTSPLGTKVRLKRQDIQDGTPDVEGNYDQMLTPSGPGSMSDFDGQKAGGTWRFFVSDNYAEDIGQIEIATLNLTGFVEQVTPVPLVGWLGGALAAGLAGWLCQRSARRRLG